MRRSLLWLAIGCLAVIAIILAMPAFLSAGPVKNRIAAQLSDIAGMPVRLGGRGAVSFWPFLQVRYFNVTVGEGAVLADRPPPIFAEELQADLDWSSAFWGRVSTSRIALVRPQITILRAADGGTNFRSRNGRIFEALSGDAAASRTTPLGTLTLSDGRLVLRNQGSDGVREISSLSGSIDWSRADRALSASMQGVWNGQPTDIDLQIDRPVDWFGGGPSDVSVEMRAGPAGLAFQGSSTGFSLTQIDGDLSVSSPSSQRLLDWLGIASVRLPASSSFSLSGPVEARDGRINVPSAAFSIGENSGTGRLRMDLAASRPTLEGTLAFDNLVVPPLATLALLDDTAPLDLGFMDDLSLDLRLSATRVESGGLALQGVAASLLVNDGRTTLEIGDAQALDGRFAGSLVVTSRPSASTWRGDFALNDIDLARLPALPFPEPLSLDGTGSLRATLQTSGTGIKGLRLNLVGDGTLRAREGTVNGISFARIAAPEGTINREAAFTGSTGFDDLTVPVSLHGGRAYLRGARLRNGELEANLSGRFDLAPGAMALRGAISMPSESGEARTSRFFVGGTVSSPLLIGLSRSPQDDAAAEQEPTQ